MSMTSKAISGLTLSGMHSERQSLTQRSEETASRHSPEPGSPEISLDQAREATGSQWRRPDLQISTDSPARSVDQSTGHVGRAGEEETQAIIAQHLSSVVDTYAPASGNSWKSLKNELSSAAEVLSRVSAQSSMVQSAPSAPAGPPAGAANLQAKLQGVLQSIQQVDKTLESEVQLSNVGPTPQQVSPASTLDPLEKEAWWKELQEKHPELTRLVQTQHQELVGLARPSRGESPSTTVSIPESPQAQRSNGTTCT